MSRMKLPGAYDADRNAYTQRAAELARELDGRGVLCGIVTRYLGPTNNRGSRIVAELSGGAGRPSVAIAYPYELNELGRHTMAAMALVEALNEDEGPTSPDAMKIVRACATRDGYAFTIGRA